MGANKEHTAFALGQTSNQGSTTIDDSAGDELYLSKLERKYNPYVEFWLRKYERKFSKKKGSIKKVDLRLQVASYILLEFYSLWSDFVRLQPETQVGIFYLLQLYQREASHVMMNLMREDALSRKHITSAALGGKFMAKLDAPLASSRRSSSTKPTTPTKSFLTGDMLNLKPDCISLVVCTTPGCSLNLLRLPGQDESSSSRLTRHPYLCLSCDKYRGICSICHCEVLDELNFDSGEWLSCKACGHGGHGNEMEAYFHGQSANCPICNHDCTEFYGPTEY